MEKWEIALEKFIKQWKTKKYVEWILVCWSYVTWNPSKHSDIDIQILLSDDCEWRQRWNHIIDWILIEYFANPSWQILKEFESEYKLNRRVTAHMFLSWKIYFDKNGQLKTLKNKAKYYYKKKFKKQPKWIVENNKYHIWDMYDNLLEIYNDNWEEFEFFYFNVLKSIFEVYWSFVQFEKIWTHKIRRFLINNDDIKKYNIEKFQDEKFIKLFILAQKLAKRSDMIKNIENLLSHVLESMWWFNIDGWKLKWKINNC